MTTPTFDLTGKTAVITGASRGIGAATARVFAQCGARVVLVARSADQIEASARDIGEAGGEALCVPSDVSQYDSISAALEQGAQAFGGIDIVINNAGVIEPIGLMASSDPQRWAAAADINYKGVYFSMHAATPHLKRRGGGVIVNLSSGAAHRPLEGWSHYCSAKAAVAMLTRSAHLELAADNIRTLGLSPGTIATDMQVRIKASGLNPVSQMDPSAHADPVWPARALAWMCTDAARDFDGEEVALADPKIRKIIGMT